MSGTQLGKIRYHAGASGTVTLAAGEILLHVRALGGSGGTLAINGGDTIPLPANYVFETFNNSGHAEFVGASLVFTSTTSYFCKTLQPLP